MNAIATAAVPTKLGRVLVIDDDPAFSSFTRKYLEGLGFQVLLAEHGDPWISTIQAAQPDLILLDWCLKGPENGIDILRALKSDETLRSIPAIIISGIRDGEQDEADARRAGAASFFTKHEISERIDADSPFIRQLKAMLLIRRNPEGQSSIVADKAAYDGAKNEEGDGFAYHFTVLVIDDEEDTVAQFKLLLTASRFTILSAESGEKGLRLAATELPDLVVLDLNMPGMDGREVYRRLKQQEKTFSLPILIYTADQSLRHEAQLLEAGVDEYLVKPTPHPRLMARIRKLLYRRFNAAPKGVMKIGGFALQTATGELILPNGERLPLRPLETVVLSLLMSAAGKPIGPRVLFKKTYGSWPVAARQFFKIRKQISNIRRALGSHKGLVRLLRKEGYCFDADHIFLT